VNGMTRPIGTSKKETKLFLCIVCKKGLMLDKRPGAADPSAPHGWRPWRRGYICDKCSEQRRARAAAHAALKGAIPWWKQSKNGRKDR